MARSIPTATRGRSTEISWVEIATESQAMQTVSSTSTDLTGSRAGVLKVRKTRPPHILPKPRIQRSRLEVQPLRRGRRRQLQHHQAGRSAHASRARPRSPRHLGRPRPPPHQPNNLATERPRPQLPSPKPPPQRHDNPARRSKQSLGLGYRYRARDHPESKPTHQARRTLPPRLRLDSQRPRCQTRLPQSSSQHLNPRQSTATSPSTKRAPPRA